MAYDTLNIEYLDRVARVTLNRPERYNAFSAELRKESLDAFTTLNEDKDIRVIILCGSGPGFSAGADLSETFPIPISDQLDGEYKPAIEALYNSPKITISQVHGKAAGIGAGFALATDLTVMAADAGLYLAFAALGLVPDGGITWHLERALGRKRATEIIVEGQTLSAADCAAAGLANKVVASGDLEAATLKWAQKLSLAAPVAVQEMKRVMRDVGGMDLGQAISAEAKGQDVCQISKDHARALKAFKNKEMPVFKGD